LRPAQIFVLHLEFDLVDAQLVERGPQGFCRQHIEILQRVIEHFPEDLFRPLAKGGRLRRLWTPLIHWMQRSGMKGKEGIARTALLSFILGYSLLDIGY